MQAPTKIVCVLCMQEVTMGIYIIVPSPFTLEELLPLLGFYMEGSNL
jgi:hypothetical protein